MSDPVKKTLEGVFFIRDQTKIPEDWCPICNKWTRFVNAINIRMNSIEKRKLDCGHEITYIFLTEQVHGENVQLVRKRVC
jgi:hypothetical protein